MMNGVKTIRPMPAYAPNHKYAAPRIADQWSQEGIVQKEDKQEPDKSFFFRYEKHRVVIEVMGTQIAFSKSSRSNSYVDSREPKKRFTRDEIRAEIYRMLDDSAETDRAMLALDFGV